MPPALADLVPAGRFPDILNALYGWASARPDRLPGARDPGATALEQVAANLTGLRVDYYALVDFRGFVEMVDALGGVTVDVPRPVAFPRIAAAVRRNVRTDIPRRVLPDLIDLLAGVDRGRVVSLGFTSPAYTAGVSGPGYPVPDLPAIRAATRVAVSGGGVRGAASPGGELCG